MKILDLCKEERPRERLSSRGAGALSNGELLAVLLRTGYRGHSALDVSQALLVKVSGSLVTLSHTTLSDLNKIPGIGKGKAAIIAACFELARRFLEESSSKGSVVVNSSRKAYNILRPILKGLLNEESHVLLLDSANRLISREKLSCGSLNTSFLNPPEVLELCFKKKATAFIVAHNHPSGDPTPSKADIDATLKMHEAAVSCGVTMLDHIIVCDDHFYSFAGDENA